MTSTTDGSTQGTKSERSTERVTSRTFNPDDYLETTGEFTAELGRRAWLRLYEELKSVLRRLEGRGVLYIVCGLQGAGKSTWVYENYERLSENSVFLDAALPKASQRRRPIELAKQFSIRAVAVWINTPLAVARERNSRRGANARAPESLIQRVASQFQSPTTEEGFEQVIEINNC